MSDTATATQWVVDEQQLSYVEHVFDLTYHGTVDIRAVDIDEVRSRSIGQNRTEMQLDTETVEIIAMYLDEGVAMPMPLVWKKDTKAKKYVVLDGNHRIAGAFTIRGDETVRAMLVTGDESVAQNLAVMVNTLHGRSVRDPDYIAQAMRLLRDRDVPVATVARMFGVSDERVRTLTKRDEQSERAVRLLGPRPNKLPIHTLDVLGYVEDEHIKIMGPLFLDAPAKAQHEAVERLRAAPSAERDNVAHELRGEIRQAHEERHKVRARPNTATTTLSDALSRLRKVSDPINAYHRATTSQQAVLRSNMSVVMPRLQKLWASVVGETT